MSLGLKRGRVYLETHDKQWDEIAVHTIKTLKQNIYLASEIMSCVYNRDTQKWDVKFNTGKAYSYAYTNVEKLTEPDVFRIAIPLTKDAVKQIEMETIAAKLDVTRRTVLRDVQRK